MGKKLTTDEFIERARKIHGDKYDYSLVDYKNNDTRIKIICSKHGIFEQRPNAHLVGYECYECKGNIKLNTDKFIEVSKSKHGDKYDYSLVDYLTDKKKVKIICPKHGIFEQSPNVHYNHGCLICANEDKKLTQEEFIRRSKNLHGDKFDYSLVNYVDIRTKVKLICPIHEIFEQSPASNLKGNGCSKCNDSKGEALIRDLLKSFKIKFKTQQTFDGCKHRRKLSFDFYLPDMNTCVEYDGLQHFKVVDYWGGMDSYEQILVRDGIKNTFCSKNNIKLIRIAYNENIEMILKSELNI